MSGQGLASRMTSSFSSRTAALRWKAGWNDFCDGLPYRAGYETIGGGAASITYEAGRLQAAEVAALGFPLARWEGSAAHSVPPAIAHSLRAALGGRSVVPPPAPARSA